MNTTIINERSETAVGAARLEAERGIPMEVMTKAAGKKEEAAEGTATAAGAVGRAAHAEARADPRGETTEMATAVEAQHKPRT